MSYGSLRPEYMLTWDEEGTPANDDEVVFPTNLSEADRCGLEEDDSC
jgi:hypothetical protein